MWNGRGSPRFPVPSLFRNDFGTELKETDVSGRLALVYDTRDNEYNTHQGLLLEAGAQVGSGNDGYARVYSVLRGYLSVREGTVVAARLAGSGTEPERRHSMPGTISQPGRTRSRCSAGNTRIAASTRAALRASMWFSEISKFVTTFSPSAISGAVTLLAFLDAGRVFEEPFKVTTEDMKVGGGGGVALRILRSSIFTFNFAGGPDGFNYSVGSGWMF